MTTNESKRKDDLNQILDEVERILKNHRRKSTRTRGVDEKGRNYLDVEIHDEKFHLEADEFRQYIRIYRFTKQGLYKYEYMDSLTNPHSICFKLGVW